MSSSNHDLLNQALAFHRALPDRIRSFLNGRGVHDAVIDKHLLGWTGSRVSIPIRNREGDIAFFKLRKGPDDLTASPKMYATPGSSAELYGWECVLEKAESIIICEGEFDRLVLEAQGFAAVTSTAGAGTFLPEWAPYFRDIPNVYLCFDNDGPGRSGAEHVASLIPHARAVTWPAEIGDGGDVTDWFVRLGRNADDFRALLQAARPLPLPVREADSAPQRAIALDIVEVKSSIAIERVVGRYIELRRRGKNFVGRCPFHQDRTPSFVVFPASRSYHCFGCRAHGDALTLLMKMEHLTFREALHVARQL